MRILLIATNTETEPYPVFPIGMAVVASALSGAGHEVVQYDHLANGESDERLAEAIAELAPEMVGVSLRNVDNVDSQSPDSHWSLDALRRLVAFVKARTTAPVVLGGPGFSLMPEAILDYAGGDFGVQGEGEQAIIRLAEAVSRGTAKDRIWRTNGPLDGGTIQPPMVDESIMRHYLDAGGLPGVQTKRGCTNACAYCTYPMIDGRTIRAREPGEVGDELERLERDYGVREIFFTDSVFNDPQDHYLLLAEELVRRESAMAWSAYFQPRRTTAPELALLKRAGLKAIELGTDAASDETLRGLNKGFTFDQAARFNALCVSQRVPCAHFIIFGGPDETPQTVEQGITNLAALEHCVIFAYVGIRLHTGAPLFRRAVREGKVRADAQLLRPEYYFSPHIAPDALAARITEAFKGDRKKFFPPSDSMEHMAVLRRFGYTGILWDTLIRFPRNTDKAADYATANA